MSESRAGDAGRLSIGEMVRRTGVSQRLLRYYEEQGLLAPRRAASGYRSYADADVATVRRIRSLLAAGLGTATIARILPCLGDDGQRLVPVCADLVDQLRLERERMTAAIEELHTSRGLLDDVIGAAPAEARREAP